MKKILLALATLGLGICTVGCSRFLDGEKKLGSLDTDAYYANATDEEALYLINNVYIQSRGAAPTTNTMSDELLYTGDAIYGGASTQTASMTGNFGTLYQMNYKCNMIIAQLPEDSREKTRVVGEAYFWRAWAYMHLIRGWGTPPLVDHLLTEEELQPENGNPADLWNYVYTSLDEAIKRLPSRTSPDGQRALGARVTKETAEAIYGKSAVIAGDMALARTHLANVINSGLYGLIDNYRDLYTTKADWCKEYLWEYNAEDDNYSFRDKETNYGTANVWRNVYVISPGGAHLAGDAEGRINTFVNGGFYQFLVDRGEKGKPRQLGNVWNLDDVIDMFEIYEGLSGHAAYSAFLRGYTTTGIDNCQGYFQAKEYMWYTDMYLTPDGKITSSKDICSKVNRAGMRYAEVLLLYAEACLGSSDEAKGLAALNQVRRRAGLDDLPAYKLKDVQDEKRAELFLEGGERFWDCIRWGIAAEAFAKVGDATYQLLVDDPEKDTFIVSRTPFGAYTGWQDKYKLIPFPYSEMNLNPNLKQNPGWD